MKKYFAFLVIGFLTLFFTSMNAVQDSNVVWSTNIWPVNEIFNHPDSNFIFINQNQLKRFAKIDARTGIIVDSIYNKGMVMGISKDNKYLYTRGNTLESIKKLDINTFQAIDSIDMIGDVSEFNPLFPLSPLVTIQDFKITNDNRILVTLLFGKYLFVVLDANNLEIINKKLTHSVSDNIFGAGSIAISPKNDLCVIQQLYQSLEQVPDPPTWQKTIVWDMLKIQPTNKILAEVGAAGNNFQIFTFSPDGKYFFFRFDKLRIYDTKDFSIFKEIDATRCIDFTSNKDFFVINLDPVLEYFNFSNFGLRCTQPIQSTGTFKMSIDDKYVYIFIYDGSTYNLIKSKSCINYTTVVDNTVSTPKITLNLPENELLITDRSLMDILYSYSITNINGKIVQSGKLEMIEGQGRIYLKDFQSGAYFLIINNISYKFIITR